jgi:hypothetical protein
MVDPVHSINSNRTQRTLKAQEGQQKETTGIMATKRQRKVNQSERVSSRKSPASAKGLSRDQAYALGKQLREACPRRSHAVWKAPQGRPDPVNLVLKAEEGRVPDLLPLRHGRMARSPFTFYRGAALTMASDMGDTPVSGIRVQCCGDAHLRNFGGFATPERRVIFSINDLDETLQAPWEWDVKRLAASFVVACRDNGLRDAVAKDVVMTCVRTYRESMAEFSEMKTLELWYSALDADGLVAGVKDPELRNRGLWISRSFWEGRCSSFWSVRGLPFPLSNS